MGQSIDSPPAWGQFAIMPLAPIPMKSAVKRAWQRRAVAPLRGKANDAPAAVPAPVTVAGLFSAVTGLAQAARMTADGLESLGYDVRRVDVTAAIAPQLQKLNERFDAEPETGPVIFVVNPPETLAALAFFGQSALKGRTRIGYWVYELDIAPRDWTSQADYFHHIWAPSPHAAGALKNAKIKAHMVPYPIPIWPNGLIAPEPSDIFTVISFADTQSSLRRKNPLGSIAAFTRAFPGQDDAALIIKLSNADRAMPANMAALEAACDADPRITLNTDVLTRENVAVLLSRCDVFLSLHRAEGYGLLVIEAMLQGLDTVFTTGSSTQVFGKLKAAHMVSASPCRSDDRLYKNGAWLDPDLDEAAKALRASYARFKSRGRDAALRADIRRAASETVSPQRFERYYGPILRQSGLVKVQSA